MLEHLPLIVFLVTFVLIFVLRMPIPAGMIAACTLYFLTDGLIKGVGFGALITGAGRQPASCGAEDHRSDIYQRHHRRGTIVYLCRERNERR